MGIVNRTPDSFFDQGRTFALEAADAAGLQAAAEGAQIIDIGGVPFAPGAPLPVAEEIDRVRPVVAELRERLPGILLSVDTFHADVARAAIEAGADIINDTTGFADSGMCEVVARTGAAVIICHSLADPRHPYPHPVYVDVVEEVRDFLAARVDRALEAGVSRERIILDPGPDLNKNSTQTLEMLREWREYASLGFPTLAALSRKDVIGEALGLAKEDRLEGSIAAGLWAASHGASILRVHDVAATVRAAHMIEVITGVREMAGPLVHNV
jgi:dihydropteroate synthase